MEHPIILHSYWRSSASWRVRLALALKNIDYETRVVNLLKGEQLSKEYGSLNPLHGLPTLEIDGLVLCESVAILEYLEETRGAIPLLPKEPAARAKVRQIVETVAADIHPVQNLRVLKKVGDEKKMEWAKYWIEEGFRGLEAILKECAGTYCFGDSATLADCAVIPQVYNANRFGVDMTAFPTIHRLFNELGELSAFKAAHPDAQPDCVKA